MPTLLVRHPRVVVTTDDARREIADGGVFARDGVIEAVGPTGSLPATADEVVDARGHVVLPGLVDTHDHFYQTLTRVVPAAQDAELPLSGCTASSEHLSLHPNGCRLDDVGVAGAQHDPVAALCFCHVPSVRFSVVQRRVVVKDGEPVTVDLPRLLERHNRLAGERVQG